MLTFMISRSIDTRRSIVAAGSACISQVGTPCTVVMRATGTPPVTARALSLNAFELAICALPILGNLPDAYDLPLKVYLSVLRDHWHHFSMTGP